VDTAFGVEQIQDPASSFFDGVLSFHNRYDGVLGLKRKFRLFFEIID
jgi:hypothetical protein